MDIRPRDDAPLEIETAPNPSAAVIWLHGLGADGYDFVPVVSELGLPRTPGVRFIFPHAPYRPVTLNGGYLMRAWYDLAPGEHGGFLQNAAHIRESEEQIRALIGRESQRGIPPAHLVLAGFSQGGLVALTTGLHHPQRLAGLLILSAPITEPEVLAAEAHPANVDIPIFLAHGTEDPLVPFSLAQRAFRVLLGRGFKVGWHTYCIGHTVSTEEIRDIAKWLRATLALREQP